MKISEGFEDRLEVKDAEVSMWIESALEELGGSDEATPEDAEQF